MVFKKKNLQSDDSERILKCVVVGDAYVGKTCLLSTYVNGVFPTDYNTTVPIFDNYAVTKVVDCKTYSFCLFDTAGQEDFDRIRALAYFNADVFVICFALDSNDSFRNIMDLWVKELKEKLDTRHVPIILACTKMDLQNDSSVAKVSSYKIRKVVAEIKAEKYIDCSALQNIGVDKLFDEAFKSALKHSLAKLTTPHSCSIL